MDGHQVHAVSCGRANGSLDGAGVIVVLGNNQADKTLETLAAEAAAKELSSAPAVAGDGVVAPTDPAAEE